MSRVAVIAANIIPPVLATAVVVVVLPPGVAGETTLGNLFGALILEGVNLRFVAASFDVRFARSVAGFTTLHFALPVGLAGNLCMLGLCEAIELSFMASLAALASYEVFGIVTRKDRWRSLDTTRPRRLRKRTRSCPHDPKSNKAADRQHLYQVQGIHLLPSFSVPAGQSIAFCEGFEPDPGG